MVIGLRQQLRLLWLWRITERDPNLAFARHYAIAWRVCLAIVMAVFIVLGVFYQRIGTTLSDEWQVEFLTFVFFPIPIVAQTVVLLNSIARWHSEKFRSKSRATRVWLVWCAAAFLAVVVVLQVNIVTFLTHESMAETEAAAPVEFQRPGAYPNHAGEAYRLLWLSAGAAASLAIACVLLLRHEHIEEGRRIGPKPFGLALLIVPTTFCVWYYHSEFQRVSPEFAGAGLEAGFLNWFAGGLLATGLITIAAYKSAVDDSPSGVVVSDISHDLETRSLQESAPILLIIGIHTIYSLVVAIEYHFDSSWGRRSTLFHISMWWDSNSLLVLAPAIASLQLIWLRFKHRAEAVPWEMAALSKCTFVQNWAIIAILLVVAIPTMNAFSFIAWLGPFNLLRLYGL